jgi:hypothetical protein
MRFDSLRAKTERAQTNPNDEIRCEWAVYTPKYGADNHAKTNQLRNS